MVADPHHLPRWWPRVARVEGVTSDRFTQVLMTSKGRPVRADYRRVSSQRPERVVWEQRLDGTPFERILRSSRTTIAVAPEDGGSRVTITLDQALRGWSRFAPVMFIRAARRQLDAALDGLEQACG